MLLILVQWLLKLGAHDKVTLAYDNMCNLDKLKAAKNPLPLEKPMDEMWMNVEKIIDVFHFKNHRSEQCKKLYSPDAVKQNHPHWNTQCGEQTFSWLHHFEHILCAMPKVHHLFYLHRMVLRRNMYTAKCYRKGKRPLLKWSYCCIEGRVLVSWLLLYYYDLLSDSCFICAYNRHSACSRFTYM